MKKINSREMDKILNKWLKAHECELEVALDKEFAYYHASSKITYSLVVTEEQDKLFMDFARRNGLKVECGIFILSFFHEVGHYETYDEIEDEDFDYSEDVKATLSADRVEDFETYFNLPDEICATEWAIDYINNNVAEVKALAEKLEKAFAKMKIKYSIEG